MSAAKWISSQWCRLVGHAFRRARKGEVAGSKYCKRCGVGQPIKARTKLRAVKGDELQKVVGGAS